MHAATLAARPKGELQEAVRQSIRLRLHTEALTQLRASEIGPASYDLVLQLLVASGVHFGEITKIDCMRSAIQSLCKVCYGGLTVGRTRAHYQYHVELENAGVTDNLRKSCLYCLKSRNVCVFDPKWNFVLHCPHFTDLRNSRLRNIETGSEWIESPRPSVALINLISLCTKEPTRLQSLGSFVRLSLRVREKWLQENVSGGLQFGPHVRGILPSARLYSTTEAFTCGVAQQL